MKLSRLSPVVAAMILGLLLPAGTAQAGTDTASSPGEVVCAGSNLVSYAPGLRTAKADVTATETTVFTLCKSLTDPKLTSGFTTRQVKGQISCISLGDTDLVTQTIKWNTGKTSTIQFIRNSYNLLGQQVAEHRGNVIEGQFAGSTLIDVLVAPNLNVLDCLSSQGLLEAGATSVLTINSI